MPSGEVCFRCEPSDARLSDFTETDLRILLPNRDTKDEIVSGTRRSARSRTKEIIITVQKETTVVQVKVDVSLMLNRRPI
jgi:hypothetical protein